jgi:hypothetical protein
MIKHSKNVHELQLIGSLEVKIAMLSRFALG